MAIISVWRAAYTIGTDAYERVYFSEWVTEDGIEDMESVLDELIHYDLDGLPAGDPPVVIGWQKATLDTEPI